MKAYSQDLRHRVLRAIDQGKSQAEVSETLTISTATIKRYLKARRESGHVLPKPIPGRPSIKGAALQAGLLDQLRANPDASREQHCQMWKAKTGMKVSPASVSRARMALGWTRKKKTLVASEQDEAERAAWREHAKALPPQDLVIVDETGSRINLTPLYAYAPKGARAIGKVPRNYGANLTLIASLSLVFHGGSDAAGWLGRWRCL
jgi:transposase